MCAAGFRSVASRACRSAACEVAPLLKDVKPAMELQKEGISDPEARAVAERAYVELSKVAAQPPTTVEVELATVEAHVAAAAGVADEAGVFQYVAKTALALTQAACWDKHAWVESFRVLGAVSVPVADVAAQVLEKCQVSSQPKEIEWDTEGVDLYKGEFGLAYGALTLLNTTRLQLKRNRLYGLLGPNNCGKTTLMRAIEREQIEGFPKRDELRTIFVEHEIQEREVGEDEDKFPILNIDLSGIDWVVDACNNVYFVTPPVTRDQAGATTRRRNGGPPKHASAENGEKRGAQASAQIQLRKNRGRETGKKPALRHASAGCGRDAGDRLRQLGARHGEGPGCGRRDEDDDVLGRLEGEDAAVRGDAGEGRRADAG